MLLAVPAAAQVPMAAPPSPAPAPEPELHVGRVSVTGNVTADSTRILRTFEVRSGDVLSLDAVRRGLRKVMALGVFSDGDVQRSAPHDGVVDLTVVVREKARIAKIDFQGNAKKSTEDLKKKLFLRTGEVYSAPDVRAQVDTLLKVYKEAGYSIATVEAATDTLAGNTIGLRFVIHEGEKVRITRIEFTGVHVVAPKKLAKQMKTKKKGFFGGGEPDDSKYPEDKEKIEAWYHNHGWRDARVTSETVKPGDKPKALTLTVAVDEGRLYRQGAVSWSGNKVIPTATLADLWTPKPGERYNASRIEKAQQDAYADYSERGYIYLGIEPNESVRADSVVDVAFDVTEGKPSNVRYLNIVGNRGTREKVIRREADIHEGDRFKRSALQRTQGDIFRLGLFEDVNIDFVPAESTDVDIQLKVKEKQVGTASAGAGYTGTTGLTGFIDLGHNNVLGNGQSLALHLERGNKLENYSLSFTEPWFHDTPTLLGMSIFDTQRTLDLYQEKQEGASARIGRPLPWPDYSRGSIGYSLENVTLSELTSSATTVDSIVLAGTDPGHAVLTSSVTASFLRNSADNPFYPTRGTRLSLDGEAAGGPFGGKVNFHRERLEGRLYLPSGVPHMTTMLKGRVGFVAEYLDQHLEIPPYERFRLGGGNTADPLRGYDDYTVVPKQFIHDVLNIQPRVGLGHAGQDSTFLDTLGTTRVRYPGGRFMVTYTVEEQFPIVHPLHGVLFFDAGNTWDRLRDVHPFDVKIGAGIGFRMEIPLLGNIGFDYGYGFNRDDGARFVGHFLLGNTGF